MICDSLAHLDAYLGLSKNLDTAIRFLKSYQPGEPGRIEIDGANVYATYSTPELRELDGAGWEAHRRYIDIHVDYEACETIGILPLDKVSGWGEYNAEKDCLLSKDGSVGNLIRVDKNAFVITFPWDAHKPLLGEGKASKLVVKVLTEEA